MFQAIFDLLSTMLNPFKGAFYWIISRRDAIDYDTMTEAQRREYGFVKGDLLPSIKGVKVGGKK